jgi:hypothetical protein
MVATWRAFGVGRAGAVDAQQIEAAGRDELTQAPRGVRGQSVFTLAAGAGSDLRRVKIASFAPGVYSGCRLTGFQSSTC